MGLPLKTPAEYDILLKQLQSDFETSELQRQEEVHGYIERIDALQAKLQYLAKESAETARKASDLAPGGSLEKKLADKEEQVALLMQEGQQLSKKELAHLTTIRKLRAKIQEDSKEVAEAQSRQEKAEKDAAMALERLRRAESSDKRLGEKQKQVFQLQKDIESLKSERDTKDSTIADLRRQLAVAAAEEKQAEVKMTNEALQWEKRRVTDLEDDLANLRIEKSLVSDRAQAQIKELREKVDKDAERARITELEMKTEQQMLESKLELMRARAEEVSSGATGDAQAKLLRQIETLQTQYAVASENWQGIEASLIARATSLEKERDEATRREADIRRKAREVVRSRLQPIFPHNADTGVRP
jgi:DNA repair exonuclease SbcCD ATPase subunit